MKPADAARALDETSRKVTAAVDQLPVEALLGAAQQVAQRIRALAARNGHLVAVRVVERHAGVRLTVRGPAAARYRRIAEQELAALAPAAQAEVRTQITRRLK